MVVSITQAVNKLKISINIANRYRILVFKYKLALGLVGVKLYNKNIVHRIPINYPIITRFY